MKNRILKKKEFVYKSRKIKIKSNVELNPEEVTKIFKIIQKYIRDPFRGMYYRITREIVSEIDSVSWAEIFDFKIKILLRIG